ncbi:N-acetyltransferase, partial [Acinetobacter baumannii]
PYAAVVEDMCYEEQGLIPMPEKAAMLYYCFRKKFYDRFFELYQASQQKLQQKAS